MKINLIPVWEIREDTVRSMRERERGRHRHIPPTSFSPLFFIFSQNFFYLYILLRVYLLLEKV